MAQEIKYFSEYRLVCLCLDEAAVNMGHLRSVSIVGKHGYGPP